MLRRTFFPTFPSPLHYADLLNTRQTPIGKSTSHIKIKALLSSLSLREILTPSTTINAMVKYTTKGFK
jgi:hypothetical protein